MPENLFEVRISFSASNYEALQNALYMDGIKNILEEEGHLVFYFEEAEYENIESLKTSLLNEKIIKENDFSVRKFENKNWNEEWEKSIDPVYIRNKIVIYPSWKKNELEDVQDKILIEIDPKMSFGTGQNETTQLVLELMCDNLEGTETKLLDFGCGTGILTIAGLKLGVNEAVAVDIDDDSIENAKEYFIKNDVHQRVKLLKSGLPELEEDSFDIICANIIRSVIIENIEHIREKINQRGKLFLSGILISEDQEILEYLTQNDFEVIDIVSKAEWIGIYAVKI